MSCRTILCALVLVLAAGSQIEAGDTKAAAGDWPQWRGPNRDGVSTEKGLLKEWPKDGPPQVWKAEGLGAGFSSVSVSGGRIFTMGDRQDASYVTALDLANGKELWAAKVGKTGADPRGPRSTPTVDGELVYALGQFADLVCLEAASGKERWRKNLVSDFGGKKGDGWSYSESVLIDGEKLVCTPGGKDATLLALDKKTGDVIWKAPVPGGYAAGHASIVVAEVGGIRQYVQLTAGGVVSVAAKDGKFLWTYGQGKLAPNTANIPTPIVRDNFVFCASGYGKGGALLKLTANKDTVNAEEVYFKQELNNKHGGVVLVGDYLYGDTNDSGNPYCADFMTGGLKWKSRSLLKGSGSAAVAYADGHLYIRFDNGIMVLAEATPDGYKEISSFKIPNSDRNSWSHPVIVGGKLFLREKDILVCYDIKQR